MDKIELWRLIHDLEKEHRRNKVVRFTCAVLLFSTLFMAICFFQGMFDGLYIFETLGVILGGVLFSAVYVALNSIVFFKWFSLNDHDKRMLEDYKKELEKMMKEE